MTKNSIELQRFLNRYGFRNIFELVKKDEEKTNFFKALVPSIISIKDMSKEERKSISLKICQCGTIEYDTKNSYCFACTKRINPAQFNYSSKGQEVDFYTQNITSYRIERNTFYFSVLIGTAIFDWEKLENTDFSNTDIIDYEISIHKKKISVKQNNKLINFFDIFNLKLNSYFNYNLYRRILHNLVQLNATLNKTDAISWLKVDYKYNSCCEDKELFINFIVEVMLKQLFKEDMINYLLLKINNDFDIITDDSYAFTELLNFFKLCNIQNDIQYSKSDIFNYSSDIINALKYMDLQKTIVLLRKIKEKNLEESTILNILTVFSNYEYSYDNILNIFLIDEQQNPQELFNYLEHIKNDESIDNHLVTNTYLKYLKKKKKTDELYPVNLCLVERIMNKKKE